MIMKKMTDLDGKIYKELEFRYKLLGKYPWRYFRSEENVRAEIIEPILKVLGWEIPNLEREYDKIDFVLVKNKKMRAIIEAKSLNGQETNNQLLKYINKKNCPNIAILTNGLEWQIVRLDDNNTIRCYKTVSIEKYNDLDTLSFFKLLLYDKIENIGKDVPKTTNINLWTLTKIYKERSFRVDNIKDSTKSITGRYMKDVFVEFIKCLDEWDYLYNGTIFVYPVVMKKNELPPRRKSSYPVGKKPYYINTDKRNFDKRVAIAQIIYLMGLDKTYKLVIENDLP